MMSNLSSDAQQKITKLKKSYIASLPDKLKTLENDWVNIVNQSFKLSDIESLRTISHKLAGSAGSYELIEISKSARAVEKACNEYLQSKTNEKNGIKNLTASYKNLINVIHKSIDNYLIK